LKTITRGTYERLRRRDYAGPVSSLTLSRERFEEIGADGWMLGLTDRGTSLISVKIEG